MNANECPAGHIFIYVRGNPVATLQKLNRLYGDFIPVAKHRTKPHNISMQKKNLIFSLAMIMTLTSATVADACTGITLKSKDNGVVVARTIEWGESEMENLYVIVPRNHIQQSMLPDGETGGMTFSSMYGYVGLAVVQPGWVVDGMNEAGLSAALFYFPGYGQYPKYNPENKSKTISDFQLVSWMLSRFSTIDQVKSAIQNIEVVNIYPNASTAHWRVTDSTGRQIVIEIIDGKPQIYENELGVLTNSPNFPWQIKNLNNYVNLMPGTAGPVKMGGITLSAFGAGSGLLGLPGDMTPPSRFVRASFFQTYSIPQETSYDSAMLAFHILNNFDVPLGTEFPVGKAPVNMPSATQWTISTDMKDKIIYYHTMYNRTIRSIDLAAIDFANIAFQSYPLDEKEQETIIPVRIR